MQIGVCVSHSGDIFEKFSQLNQEGFNNCQLISWDRTMWTEAESERINKAKEKYQIEITGFWNGWCGPTVWNFYEGQETLGLVPVTYRAERMKNLIEGSSFASKIGVRDIITHVGFIPENPHDSNYLSLVTALKVLGQQFKQNNQNFLFETGQETPVTLLRTIEDVGTGNMYINLDPANLILYGKGNPVDALEVFGKYVKGVHAKDGKYPTDGKNLGKEVAIGEGKVNFKALLEKLHEYGYDGAITIEREISGEAQRRDIMQAKKLLNGILDTLK